MSNRPVGILLAAGQSSRFGSNKMLHPVFDDISMLFASAQTLVSVLSDVVVVINPELTQYISQLEELGLTVVVNKHFETGMGSSIACGVRASENVPGFNSGWLIALADMPYIKPETISLLLEKMNDGAEIVAPVFEQQRGHPVGFNHHYMNELLLLSDDIGARNIISKHKDNLELVSVRDEGVIKDIDYSIELI